MKKFLVFITFITGLSISCASLGMAMNGAPESVAITAIVVGGILMFAALFRAID